MATSRASSTDVSEDIRLARWPGLLSLAMAVLLGPIAALVNHGIIYVAMPWACGHDRYATLHIIPVICLLTAVGAGVLAYAEWTRVGGGLHAPDASVRDRSRFLALCGLATSALSVLLILSQWLAIFVFGPCMRA